MKIFKIHYKIISGTHVSKHVFILKEENSTTAMASFNSFMKSNLKIDEKLFGPASITEIPDDIKFIYSSYIV